MKSHWTFPGESGLDRAASNVPDFMRPSLVPHAAVLESFLSDEECDEILKIIPFVPGYTVRDCGAVTREIPFDPALDPIERAARILNDWYFKFDLDPGQHSWLQTYETGGEYQRHADGSPGQTRKLTAVAMLSHPLEYVGGTLELFSHPPQSILVPRLRGTIVVFQHWMEHEVRPVTAGVRQTINMGFWGPPFR